MRLLQPFQNIYYCISTIRVSGTGSSASGSDLRDIVGDKQQQILLSTEVLAHVGFHIHWPGSCFAICIRQKANTGNLYVWRYMVTFARMGH